MKRDPGRQIKFSCNSPQKTGPIFGCSVHCLWTRPTDLSPSHHSANQKDQYCFDHDPHKDDDVLTRFNMTYCCCMRSFQCLLPYVKQRAVQHLAHNKVLHYANHADDVRVLSPLQMVRYQCLARNKNAMVMRGMSTVEETHGFSLVSASCAPPHALEQQIHSSKYHASTNVMCPAHPISCARKLTVVACGYSSSLRLLSPCAALFATILEHGNAGSSSVVYAKSDG